MAPLTTEAELRAALDAMRLGLDALANKMTQQTLTIAELQAGTPLTQDQLDTLNTEAAELKARIDDLVRQ
jgi:hypothetical protein